MTEVGKLIAEVVSNLGSQSTIQEARRRVKLLTDRHPLYDWKQQMALARP
jgi:glycine/serine hydroxymethyltransferase